MAGRAWGSRPGHGLAPPLAQRPRQRHANHPRPASCSMRSARSSAVRRGAQSTGYKSPSPRALAIVHHPPPFGGHTLRTGTKREEGEGEGRRGRKRRGRRGGGGRRSRRRRRRFVTDVARHGTARPHRSCTASHRHGIAIQSSTPPTVSFFPSSGLSLPPDLTVGHGAPRLEHIGQCLASATWNTCTHAHIEITVTPHRSP